MKLILFDFDIYRGLFSREEIKEWFEDFLYIVIIFDDMIYLVIKSIDVFYFF